jgi:hypothetical protein
MSDLSWIAEIVFFTSYFVAWCANQLPHVLWVTVSAIAAIVIAVLLFLYHGRTYVVRPQ